MLSQHRIARMKPLTNYNITNYLTNMKYRKNLHQLLPTFVLFR